MNEQDERKLYEMINAQSGMILALTQIVAAMPDKRRVDKKSILQRTKCSSVPGIGPSGSCEVQKAAEQLVNAILH